MLPTATSESELLDALPVTVYTTDRDGRLTSVHRPASRFGEDSPSAALPRSDDELRGQRIWDVLGDGTPRARVEQTMALLRAGRVPVGRWEIVRGPADDARVWLAQMTPLHDTSHAVTGFVVSVVDITASHRVREATLDAGIALARGIEVQRAYHEAAHQLRRVLRPDRVTVALAADDDATLRVAYDSGHEDDRRAAELRFASSWRAALDAGEVTTAQSDTGAELTAPLLGANGALGVMTVVVDAIESPEKLADAHRFLAGVAIQTAAAIERARLVAYAGHRRRADTIAEVTAGVAHELRNPIFGISSAAQLLRFRAREDPVVEKNVGRILREVERLNRMVTTLLELGRPVALKLAPGDPDAVWDDVLASERGRLESRAVALRRVRPATPASVAIDAEQLAQVFRSILSNAVDAAPEASDITLHSALLPNGSWRCRLTNGGPPIAPELLPRVFELFLSTKPGSTGIGLALSQRIVEDHHGAIAIDSTAENGTTVSVTLPRA